jgi:hypothetical protein
MLFVFEGRVHGKPPDSKEPRALLFASEEEAIIYNNQSS